MDDRIAVASRPASSEALSTGALFLSMIGIIGFALTIGAFGLERIGLTFGVGLLSLTSFVVSMFFFRAEAAEFGES